MKFNLVGSARDAIAGIDRFQNEIEILSPNLSYAVAWYAYKDSKGEWLIGPSKFIGYKNLEGSVYMQKYREISGSRTESVLKRFARPVPESSALYSQLFDQLSAMLSKFDKAPSQATRFSVITPPTEAEFDEDSPLLELMVRVAQMLPTDQRRELRDRLK